MKRPVVSDLTHPGFATGFGAQRSLTARFPAREHFFKAIY
jgi:hypothetical protein